MFGHLTNIVEYEGVTYFVSTNDTFDMGLETMIFTVNPDAIPHYTLNDIDWSGVYTEHYRSNEEAYKKHNYIINHIGEFVNN